MKAVVCTKYGPPEVLQIQEVEKPVPKDNEVLVKVFATTVNSGDVRIRGFDVPALPWIPFRLYSGIRKPRINILGSTFSGEVEVVGKDVKNFKDGDKVFGSTDMSMGTNAEYVSMPEDGVIGLKPSDMTFEEAAALTFGGQTALYFIKKGNVQAGQKILVYGASGAIGTFAVQLAKNYGAEVTGVCSTSNLDLVKSLGADKVIDYTKDDFTKNGETYDVIFDTVGKSPFSGSLRSIKKDGYYLRAVHLTLSPIIRGLWASMTTSKKVLNGVAFQNIEDLVFLKELMVKGKLKAVIDRTYPLEQIVEAHRYVDTGHKKGNVVITIGHILEGV